MNSSSGAGVMLAVALATGAIAFVAFKLLLVRARYKQRFKSTRSRLSNRHWTIRLDDWMARVLAQGARKARRRRH